MPLLRRHGNNPSQQLSKTQLKNYKKYLLSNSQLKLWGISSEDYVPLFTSRMNNNLSSFIASFYQLYAQHHNKSIWGDKTPSFFRMIPVIAQLFPDAKFINVIRDGRDIYLSWKKMDHSKSNIAVGALEWKYKISKSANDLQEYAFGRFLNMRYEDLVSDPRDALEGVCRFLDIPFESTMLDFWKNSSRFIGDHHSSLIFQPPSTASVGKWKTVLSALENNIFESIAYDCLVKYNYPLLEKPQNHKKLRSWCRLIYGLPRRSFQVFLTAFLLSIASRFGLRTKAAGHGSLPISDNEHTSCK